MRILRKLKNISSSNRYDLLENIPTDHRGQTFKRAECFYTTIHKTNLQKHTFTLKNLNENNESFYTKKHKEDIKKHTLTNKKFDDLPTFKCKGCSFETTYKCSLERHNLTHKSLDEVQTFECSECLYITK